MFKFIIAQRGTPISFIGDGTQDYEWNVVFIANLGNGSSFHFDAYTAKVFDNTVFGLFGGNELITGAYTSLYRLDIR